MGESRQKVGTRSIAICEKPSTTRFRRQDRAKPLADMLNVAGSVDRSQQALVAVMRDDRRRLRIICSEALANHGFGIVLAAEELGAAAAITHILDLRSMEIVIIQGATFGAGEPAGDPPYDILVWHVQIQHVVEMHLPAMQHFV